MLSTDLGKGDIYCHMIDQPRITGGHTASDLLPGGLGEHGLVLWLHRVPQLLGEVASRVGIQVLFGSYPHRNPTADSDVDVLVVLPKSRCVRRDEDVRFRLKARADFPVDLLVRGEAEMERRVKQQDLFMLDVTEKGRLMYEAVHA